MHSPLSYPCGPRSLSVPSPPGGKSFSSFYVIFRRTPLKCGLVDVIFVGFHRSFVIGGSMDRTIFTLPSSSPLSSNRSSYLWFSPPSPLVSNHTFFSLGPIKRNPRCYYCLDSFGRFDPASTLVHSPDLPSLNLGASPIYIPHTKSLCERESFFPARYPQAEFWFGVDLWFLSLQPSEQSWLQQFTNLQLFWRPEHVELYS